jgi:diguanylate cyclase (GGDEF)-like protein
VTAHRRSALWTLGGLVVLGLSLLVTPPTSVGFQADNTVLGLLVGLTTVRTARAVRGRSGRAALAGRALAAAGALFTVSCLVTGSGVSGAFGEAGIGDLLLVPVLVVPPLVCVLLAAQVRTTGLTALLVDAAAVVLALWVTLDLLVLAAPGRPAPDPLALGYVAYGVLAVGLAGGLCAVTTREQRGVATTMVAANLLVAVAVVMLAAGIDEPGLVWQAVGDVACVLCFELWLVAVRRSLQHTADPVGVVAGSPRVNPTGLAITLLALVGLPVALVVAAVRGQQPSAGTVVAVAAVVLLLLARNTLRIRTSTRLVAEVVRNEEDVRSLVEGSTDGVVIVDDALRVHFASPAARTLLDLPADTGAGTLPLPLLTDLLLAEDRARVVAELDADTPLHVRVPGPVQPTELEVTPHRRADGARRVLHLRDVTVRRRRERELERMAYTDHLTQLPNRAQLFRELTRPAGPRGLLVVDLDGFKAVNDVAGHESGDQLLIEVAVRLSSVVRDQDLVCRLGGDEFAIVVDGSLPDAMEAAQRVVDVMALPHRAAGQTFAIGASVGVAAVGEGGGRLAFREADAALRAAKLAGKGCVRVHDEHPSEDADAVALALAEGRIELRWTVTGSHGERRAVHVEPFWQHPDSGLRGPAELWAAAGREGVDAQLQTWVLDRACRETADLPGVALLAVDLPAGHVHADQLVDDVRRALAAAGLPAGMLSLALTEEALQTSPIALAPALHELHALGVRICLDDYGLGQTLHSHLARIPLTSVRIDVAALGGRGDDELTVRAVRAVVLAAGAFGLTTVAHGVSPGPLLDAVLAAGVHTVRTREDLQHVSLERVQQELAPQAGGSRILAG